MTYCPGHLRPTGRAPYVEVSRSSCPNGKPLKAGTAVFTAKRVERDDTQKPLYTPTV
jgi:hypothetical protein